MTPELGTKAARATALKKTELKRAAAREGKYSKHNASKINESWIRIMRSVDEGIFILCITARCRSYKTQQLRRDIGVISYNHERDVDRKDAVMQMLDRDLDEGTQERHVVVVKSYSAEEQHQIAVRSVFADMDTLIEIFKRKLRAEDDKFQRQVKKDNTSYSTEFFRCYYRATNGNNKCLF